MRREDIPSDSAPWHLGHQPKPGDPDYTTIEESVREHFALKAEQEARRIAKAEADRRRFTAENIAHAIRIGTFIGPLQS